MPLASEISGYFYTCSGLCFQYLSPKLNKGCSVPFCIAILDPYIFFFFGIVLWLIFKFLIPLFYKPV